jgi:hypothetical protein
MPTTQGYVGIIRGVAVGSYGQTLLITLKDLDGNVQDASSYDGTNTAVAVSPDGRKTVTATTSWNTDGSDGILSWTWADGAIDRSGDWLVQLVLNKTGGRTKSYVAKMPVIPGLSED